MADQPTSVRAVWSRIPLPHTTQSASVPGFDPWLWHPQQEPIKLTQELRAQLRKQGWKRLPKSPRLEQLFCLRGQLLPVRTLETSSGEVEYWADQIDIEHVNAVPVALAFSLPKETQVDQVTANISVSDPLPPARIGEVSLVIYGNKAIPYTIDTLGTEGRELWTQLGTLITGLITDKASFDSLSELPEELQVLTQQLAIAYHEAHKERMRSARELSESPHIFKTTTEVPIPFAIPIQGVLTAFSNAASGAPGWEHRPDRVPRYTYKQGEATTKVELRGSTPVNNDPDKRTILSLWKKVRTLSDLDGDVFLILLAQAMKAIEDGAPSEAPIWIRATQILDYRDLRPITKKEESKLGKQVTERLAGHRTEDIKETAERMGRLEDTWLNIRQMIVAPPKSGRGRARPRLFVHESRLILIDERMRQRELRPDEDITDDLEPFDGSEDSTLVAVAWRYHLGTWITPFLTGPNRQMALLCQQALKYHPEKELPEKRLARYFLFHLRLYAAQTQTIVRTIKNLFDELTLPVDERNPERTRQRFESALDCLVKDHQIDEWSYAEDYPPLPRNGWLPLWMTWKMRFSATPLTVVDGKIEQGELFPATE